MLQKHVSLLQFLEEQVDSDLILDQYVTLKLVCE